jgi:hypothetical protein
MRMTTTLVRWRFVPKDGDKRLTDDEMKGAAANFLEPVPINCTRQGPVQWGMMLSAQRYQALASIPWPKCDGVAMPERRNNWGNKPAPGETRASIDEGFRPMLDPCSGASGVAQTQGAAARSREHWRARP